MLALLPLSGTEMSFLGALAHGLLQVCLVYRLQTTWDERIRKLLEMKEFVNHSHAARMLQIFLVFYQHPAWFISL